MMRAWLTQHAFVFFHTLKRLIATPVTSLLSVTVMGIALSLPTGIYVLMENLQSLSGQAASTPQMSLFLQQNAQQNDFNRVKQRLQEESRIVSFQFISKEVALKQLQQDSGLADVMAGLTRNPLPDAFIVHLEHNSSDTLEQLRAEMQSWPEVAHVQFDSEWIERLNALLQLGRAVILMLATLLSVAIIAIMFNTIRLQILTKRDEIEISKLIGATDSFIHRPFLYFGTIQGLAGGIAAWLIVTLFIGALNEELGVLAGMYEVDIHLQHLSLQDSLSLLLFSAWLGWLGARISVANHLWQIEPR